MWRWRLSQLLRQLEQPSDFRRLLHNVSRHIIAHLLPHYYRRRHRVYRIQDNASYHKKPEVLEYFTKPHRRIAVFPLPPCSPDFNATERFWHYTRKASTHNRYFDCPEAWCHALFTTFADVQKHPEKIQGLLTPFFQASYVVSGRKRVFLGMGVDAGLLKRA